jgi:hypothetical protein
MAFMRILLPLNALLLIVSFGSGLAQGSPALTTAKVKIEAPELDRRMLLQKLNAHGVDHGIKFEEVETDYDYRIVFGTGQGKTDSTIWGSGGSFNSSRATADVFDGKGTELFRFDRNQRGTDAGATNAVAKEIIKRILKLSNKPK